MLRILQETLEMILLEIIFAVECKNKFANELMKIEEMRNKQGIQSPKNKIIETQMENILLYRFFILHECYWNVKIPLTEFS